jgi:ribonucleotide reductase beta subunit family protein with ferritin-like domain
MKIQLLAINTEKFTKSFQLYENIILKNPKFDSNINYTSEELEIFDALTSRFVRIYETSIQLFKTYDSLQSLNVAESFVDLIANCSKLNLITKRSYHPPQPLGVLISQ